MLDFSREFLVLARSANFVKAASELHISQPSLTRHIASLERELGFRLLNRRTMNLTSAGRFYLGAISNLITELDEIVERSLKQAAMWDELKDRLNKSALGLSGGQQQRLCIARALAVGPQILLMDEPTSALDPISTGKIEELCEELKKDVTIVMVTHNMQQAARISDKTAFFLLGEMIEMGDTEQVFSEPRHPETERYITGRFG